MTLGESITPALMRSPNPLLFALNPMFSPRVFSLGAQTNCEILQTRRCAGVFDRTLTRGKATARVARLNRCLRGGRTHLAAIRKQENCKTNFVRPMGTRTYKIARILMREISGRCRARRSAKSQSCRSAPQASLCVNRNASNFLGITAMRAG